MHLSIMRFLRKTVAVLFISAAFAAPLSAQITYSTGYTATDIATYLAGDGVEISGATVNCYSLAFGKFNCIDCNVGIDSGVVLTSGRVLNITGPNNSGSTGTSNGWPGDPDLDAYPGVGTTHDACILEFDVYSPGDSLGFDYVFGSDEYPEYVGSINDAFVFWISGPGFATPTNIALIPGTALPVTIDNVNAGSYPMYYISNGTGGVGVWGTDPYYIEYDGFTTVLSAQAVVTPCQWYHLKLSIADESDFIFDSGVFLKAKSLVTNYLADFTYPGFPFGIPINFCSTEPDPTPAYAAGAAAGEFSATPAGLVFDPITGTIDLDASVPGTYDFTNTILTGLCTGDTAIYTMNITIWDPPVANFSYLGSPYCANDPDPSPIPMIGATLGTFSSTPGLVINPLTGLIDLDASVPGTYTITNSVLSGTVCPDASATYDITIYPVYSSVVDATACLGDVYALPDGTTVMSSGTYVTTLNTVNGCDSVITTNIIFNPVYNLTLNPSICSGGSYTLPDGTTVFAAGTYVNNFVTVSGCDSIYTINLTVSPTPVTNVVAHLCDGETYVLPDGTVVGATGIYPVTLIAVTGCDSTISTTVLVHTVFDINIDAEICDDATYTLPDGSVVNTTGTYISNFLTVWGCDSIITTNLTVHPTYLNVITEDLCIGESYVLPDGTSTTVSGVWNYPNVSVFGCDSTTTVTVTVHPLPVLTWEMDSILCLEQGVVSLEASPAGGAYSGTGIAGTDFNTNTAGVGGPYTLTYDYTDVWGCSNSISVETSVDDNYATAWGDTTVYYGENATLYSDAGGDYTWSPTDGIVCANCPVTEVLPPFSIDYVMTSYDENGCVASDDVMVTVLPDPGNIIYIPNTFTPNGDNINDVFFVFGYNFVMINKIEVYDRWGEMVFFGENITPNDVSKGWDGTFKGQAANNGVYAYVIQVQFETGQKTSQFGNVTLIR